jgi:RNase H-fold protein (predicted Holliday junction resolvase)
VTSAGLGLTIGIDPGSAKCGYAVVGANGARVALEVLNIDDLAGRLETEIRASAIAAICIGHATNSRAIEKLCRSRWPQIPVVIVDETNTTLDARRRYYDEHPPKGLLRLLPRGLLVPSEPLDGYAALIIIERWMAGSAGESPA